MTLAILRHMSFEPCCFLTLLKIILQQSGFGIMVELPLDAILTGALNASVGPPRPGSNGTIAYPITSGLALPANGTASQIVNTTIASSTQVPHSFHCDLIIPAELRIAKVEADHQSIWPMLKIYIAPMDWSIQVAG